MKNINNRQNKLIRIKPAKFFNKGNIKVTQKMGRTADQKPGFPPIIGRNPKILMLGIFPGEESLKQNQYYAFGRNAFWYIICKLTKLDPEAGYENKKKILIKNRIALWDVLRACERKGSSDQAIKEHSIEINDFNNLFAKYNSIKYIFFNGGTAGKYYGKYVLPILNSRHQGLEYQRLPSTSPAMARLTKEQKYKIWSMSLKGFLH